MLKIEFNDRELLEALQELQRSTSNLRPALKEIGETLIESTKHRFETTTTPDGERWPANSQATYESYLDKKTGRYEDGKRVGNKKGFYLKDGSIGVRSARLLSDKKPLTGETGSLMDYIHYNLLGGDALEIGSPMEYAAMQQFGGDQSEFPWLWGDIPARPFLGISEDDKNEILAILKRHLSQE
jgi:phage gpG-like protein